MAVLTTTPAARRALALAAPAVAWALGLPALAAEPPAPRPGLAAAAVSPEGAKRALDPRTPGPAEPKPKPKPTEAPPGDAPARPGKTVTPPTLTPAGLDALVDKTLEAARVQPAAATTDTEFVRRLYLDTVGKPPTPEQTRAFVTSREKDKRAKLIDRLLASPEFAANWARYWRDVIRYHATNQNVARVGFPELETWLAAQIARNRPWDEVARDLITATGRTDQNGAVSFTLAHEAQPVEVAGEVARIFLGVQIQCAQCHDHPNDSWKRRQFHEFAAFFAGARARRANQGQMPPVFEVVRVGKPRYTMPDLKDPKTLTPVAPKFFLAVGPPDPKAVGLSAAERHELAAAYVTGQDNPWFARAYVNRVWYALTGDAFTTPVDDMGPERTARAPEVLDALADQWQRGGYDARWLFRTVLNSKTYQREVRSTFSASGRTPFAANCPTRLRADQIFDSLAQALDVPFNGPGPGAAKGAGKGAAKKNDAAGLKGVAGKKGAAGRPFTPRVGFNALFGVDPSAPGDDAPGTIPQALFLMNNPLINRAIQARNGTVLGEILAATPDNRAALDALYLRVLAREPNAREVQTCGRYVEAVGDRREAFEDILWSLINSTEFITRR